MLLNELFNSPIEYNYLINSDEEVRIEFHVGGIKYELHAVKDNFGDLEYLGSWTISFIEMRSNGGVNHKLNSIPSQTLALKVIPAVVEITRKLIAEKNITHVVFTAVKAEPSRVSLYRRLAQKLKPSNWEFTEVSYRGEIEFNLREVK